MITLKAYIMSRDGVTKLDTLALKLKSIKKLDVNRQAKASTRRSEEGYEYTDNMSVQSNKISLSGYVSDINKDDSGEWISEKAKGEAYISSIENDLKSIYNNKYFCDITDGKRGKIYKNYVILSLKISEKAKSTKGFEYSMDMQEVRFSEVGRVSYNVDTSKGASYGKGKGKDGKTKDDKSEVQSWMKQGAGRFGL